MTSTLEAFLKDRIIGQDQVIEEFSEHIDLATSGFRYTNGPISSSLFLGPTGVGKTHVAILTCEYLFMGENTPRLARFDMSEYNTPESIHKLLGGHGQASIFEILYDKTGGKGLILWDELEKGYTLILDTLLQALDAGRVTVASGRVLDLSQYILIATSNIGSQMLMDSQTTRRDKIKKRVENAALETLRPEILGRFKKLCSFNKLGGDSTYRIAEIHSQECLRISREMHHSVTLSENAVDAIRRAGYSERFGARPIKDQAMEIIGGAIRLKQRQGVEKVSGTLTYDARTRRYDIQ